MKKLSKFANGLKTYLEDRLELTEEVKSKLDQSRAEIAAGRYNTRKPT